LSGLCKKSGPADGQVREVPRHHKAPASKFKVVADSNNFASYRFFFAEAGNRRMQTCAISSAARATEGRIMRKFAQGG
jgi:hypothetical protein